MSANDRRFLVTLSKGTVESFEEVVADRDSLIATISALQSRLERAEAVVSAAQEACDHAIDMGDWDEIPWEYMGLLRHSLLCMTHNIPAALDEQDKASMTEWIDVKIERPLLDETVLVRLSGGNGSHTYAFGARVDDGDGRLWGLQAFGHGIDPLKDARLGNGIEADDEYLVTHWQPLPTPPKVTP